MKRNFVLPALLSMVLVCLTISCSKDDAEENVNAVETDANVETEDEADISNGTNSTNVPDVIVGGKVAVNLGLPSGTLWATCNVGADKETDYGDYFAWGETNVKESYDWKWYNYKWYDGVANSFTKYCTDINYGKVDDLIILQSADDAATINWGSGWRMPTNVELQELMSAKYCKWTWKTIVLKEDLTQVIKGYEVKSKLNGKSIFLPATGYKAYFGDENHSDPYEEYPGMWRGEGCAYYWSSSLSASNPNLAYVLRFYDSDFLWDAYNRYYGFSVRPVCNLNQ